MSSGGPYGDPQSAHGPACHDRGVEAAPAALKRRALTPGHRMTFAVPVPPRAQVHGSRKHDLIGDIPNRNAQSLVDIPVRLICHDLAQRAKSLFRDRRFVQALYALVVTSREAGFDNVKEVARHE